LFWLCCRFGIKVDLVALPPSDTERCAAFLAKFASSTDNRMCDASCYIPKSRRAIVPSKAPMIPKRMWVVNMA
jgi:hypothetical protein